MAIVGTLKKIPFFFKEVQQELKKVSWSSREELLGATWVVIATTLLLAFYIGTIDFGLSKFLTVFLR
jgi:preprotein translocase subunit SecE